MTQELILSERQEQIWKMYESNSKEEIADELGVQVSTVDTHLDRIYKKRKEAQRTIEWMEEMRD